MKKKSKKLPLAHPGADPKEENKRPGATILFIGIIASAVIYAVAWLVVSLPYRPFPSDEVRLWLPFISLTNLHDLFSAALSVHNPVFYFAIAFFKYIWSFFSADTLSALLFFVVISNSIILFLTACIVYDLTRRPAAVLAAFVIFGTAGWPANYNFFCSYAPLPVLLSLFLLFSFIRSYLDSHNHGYLAVRNGIVTGLLVWCAPHAIFMAAANLVFFLALFPPWRGKENKRSFVYYCVSALVVAMLFAMTSAKALATHISENLTMNHYGDAFHKFGFVPRPPPFCFFHIASVYNGLLPILFFAASAFFIAFFIHKKSQHETSLKENNVILLLVAYLFMNVILFDILPSTKLGRTYYFLFPLTIIIIVSIFSVLTACFRGRPRYFLYSLYALVCVALVTVNIGFASKMIQSRKSVPDFLGASSRGIQWFVLNEDPHGFMMARWLSDFNVRSITLKELESLISGGAQVGLIIGPHGEGSGRSVLWHATLNDFFITVDPGKAKEISLPYYAYFPSFLMEEEVSQSLYFMHKIPSYEDRDKKLTLFIYNTI